MQSLPPDVQLDILKCLNFEQIFSFKQTNFYFRNLINKYENGLARKKLYQLLLVFVNTYTHRKSDLNKVIEPESGVFELALNDQLKNKWKTAIAKSIPLFLHDYEAGKYNFMVAIYKKGCTQQRRLILSPRLRYKSQFRNISILELFSCFEVN
ncbi:unnamed protein product [Meloidogyne enterolobii]|uniref:Uncharacterized protein n=1 Tax=Meloidogyne enterolobii TaxID=390850 RepID=A0ACB0Y941_MELEN